MKSCDSCPNKALAMLARAFGAEDVARQIEAAGCPWWQIQPIGDGTDYEEKCAAEEFDRHMRRFGGWMKLAVNTIQADRNEQAKALESVQAAVEKHGGSAVLQSLAQLGLRAGVGHKIVEEQRAEAAQLEEGDLEDGGQES